MNKVHQINAKHMENVKLKLDEKARGAFYIMEGDEEIAVMDIGLSGKDLSVYHTEVSSGKEHKGLAKKLLAAMVDYARKNALKVIPLCPYVHQQFKRHPEEYADVWNAHIVKE